ncbi:type VI secretion system ATPase TssH [Acinetobacter sp. SA01]|uniref:type VI secretion system ATPase TssH n=1 Tax=Acinetobacter sp. SA01 TaxID=1862567 RepID=UPI0014098045|nr:type VI secretion system ATPase TssH [Acinetobacter sp. SA01]
MNNLKILITKLSSCARLALEKSANTCIAQRNYEIEIEHIFLEILYNQENNDIQLLLENYKISRLELMDDLKKSIAQLPKGNTRTPIFAKSIIRLLEQAWLLASAEQKTLIRTSHLLVALLTAPDLYQIAIRASSLFELLPIDHMKHNFLNECTQSIEQQYEQNAAHPDRILTPQLSKQILQTPALDRYTIDLTEKAQKGEIDPVIGRELEIRLMLDILMRRRQNNPILTGDPGVGKTAVVEGLAVKIANNQVPEALKNVHLHMLDIGLLQAGASVKGEFENRLKQVIQEVQSSSHPIILFIDEAHSLIGAGGQAGQNDAANLLKPALARGELRTIAATTWAEYKQFFEKDAALSRRFQVVKVEEPTEAVAIDMLRAMIPVMTHHFSVNIEDEAIVAAVHSSHRYISGRQLPDKAISVLDTAAARVALTQNAQPVKLDQLQAQWHNLNLEQDILEKEQQNMPIHHERIMALKAKIAELAKKISDTQAQWQKELQLVNRIKELEQHAIGQSNPDIAQCREALAQLQGTTPLVFERVNAQMIHEIISDWTGIPVGKMANDEIKQILNLKDKLSIRVIGQENALNQLVQGIKTSKAKLEDPHKPQGIFLLVGPSGVGKTETALALAHELYGGESHLISINMSEYQEAHTVSTLKGAPPGYVGYGQGGILTEAVRRNPYSVVLLDEIEKAHSDVQELFYQVFDKGMIEDSEGRLIDFKNTIILLTSNVGSSVIMQACLNSVVEEWPTAEQLIEHLKPSLYQQFKPAFLGRMRVVPYFPLHDELLLSIIKHKLGKITARLEQQYITKLSYSENLIELLLSRCTEVDSGARNVDNILNSFVLPALATQILLGLAEQKMPQHIFIDVQDNEILYQVNPVVKSIKKPRKKLRITEA